MISYQSSSAKGHKRHTVATHLRPARFPAKEMGAHRRTVMVLLFGSCARALIEGNHHYPGLSSESKGIAPLVALAHNGTDEQKTHAAHALWSLARNDDDKVAISQAGGITPLMALARDGTDQQKTYATGGTSRSMPKPTRRSHAPM